MFQHLLKVQEPKSYVEGRSLSYKVRLFDPEEFTPVGFTTTHTRYNCPYCEEVRGKSDDDGKFYWSNEKLLGYCFKCESVGIIKTDQPLSEVKLKVALNSFLSSTSNEYAVVPKLSSIPYFNMFDQLDERGKDYLLGRSFMYEELFDKIPFRVFGDQGVVVPVIIDNKIVSYQLRFYNPTTSLKYFIPNGLKYLYSPTNILNQSKLVSEVTLVEGYFDAIGALLDGYPNPIAVFGKTLTPLQITLLRSITPSKINIYMDETDISRGLRLKLRGQFPTCSVMNIVPTKNDPEDRFKMNLKYATSEDKLELVLNKVSTAISSLEGVYSNVT